MLKKISKRVGIEISLFIKWIFISIVVGIISGIIGTLFHIGVEQVSIFRYENSWIIYLLPLSGFLILLIYKVFKVEGQNTDTVLNDIENNQEVSLGLSPSIFFATLITHLFGGSAGREGAALQIGGGIGSFIGKRFNLSDRDKSYVTLAGMAGLFSALFGTPVTSTVFVITFVVIGVTFEEAFVPCLVSSLTAFYISRIFGVSATTYAVYVPKATIKTGFIVLILALLFSIVSNIFFRFNHFMEETFSRYFKNDYVRIFVGGVIIVLLTILVGSQRYNGSGMEVINLAIEQGVALPYDFLLKIIFTGITLAAGFKGGEVVPSFFIGATFGCLIAPLTGLPVSFVASLGVVCVFCGCTNANLASLIMAIEMFGGKGIALYALGVGVTFISSTGSGFYRKQKHINYSNM